MIQRIQSIFLFLAAIAMLVSAFFLDIWTSKSSTDCLSFLNSLHIGERCGDIVTSKTKTTIYIFIAEVVFSIICLYSIFNYKVRKKQLLIGGINSIIGSSILVMIVFLSKSLSDLNEGNYELGFFLPLVAIFLNILANRFIRKDEKLVKSLDRIR